MTEDGTWAIFEVFPEMVTGPSIVSRNQTNPKQDK